MKPISFAPSSAACERAHALLEVARDVLDDHDGIVDDEARRDRQRHQRQVVETVAEQVHHAERADQRNRHRHAGNDRGARRFAGTQTPPGSPGPIEITSVSSTSCTEARMVVVRSDDHGQGRSPAESRPAAAGSSARTRSTVSMMLAPGWRKTMIRTAGLPLASPALRRSSTESCTSATSEAAPAAPLLVADDQRAVLLGLEELIVGVEISQALVAFASCALRPVGVGRCEHGAHVFEADAVACSARRDSARREPPAASFRPRSPGPRLRPARASAAGCVEAASYMLRWLSTSEVSARIMIGASAGLTLR